MKTKEQKRSRRPWRPLTDAEVDAVLRAVYEEDLDQPTAARVFGVTQPAISHLTVDRYRRLRDQHRKQSEARR